VTQLLAAPPVSKHPDFEEFPDSTVTFNKESVAELSLLEIEAMSRDDLVSAIRAVVVPFIEEDRLEYQDRKTLLRLLYLARQCCRNQGY
jgi:hypothetical protein